jgi:acylphosphatase
MERIRVRVEGRVQGVFFRNTARREAERLDLSGWARNEDDGSVLMEVQGEIDAVEAFVAWAHRGPSGATVTRVTTAPAGSLEAERGFRIGW